MNKRIPIAAVLLSAAALMAGCAAPPEAPPKAASVTAPAAVNATAPTYDNAEPLGAGTEGWVYPYPVHYLQFEQEGQLLRMAYMDVQPAQPNGPSVAT